MQEGVQAAIDAHQRVSSLRSEVSALERQRHALQTKLDALNTSNASSVDRTAAAAAWIASTTQRPRASSISAPKELNIPEAPIEHGGGRRHHGKGKGEGEIAAGFLQQLKSRGDRAQRKARAAAVLRQLMAGGPGAGCQWRDDGGGGGGGRREASEGVGGVVGVSEEIGRRVEDVVLLGRGQEVDG